MLTVVRYTHTDDIGRRTTSNDSTRALFTHYVCSFSLFYGHLLRISIAASHPARENSGYGIAS